MYRYLNFRGTGSMLGHVMGGLLTDDEISFLGRARGQTQHFIAGDGIG